MVDEVALKQFAAVSPASNNSNNSIQWVYINVQAYKHKCLLQSQKKNTEYKTYESGVPAVIQYASAIFEVKIIDKLDAGSHSIFVGEVLNMEKLSEETTMTYEYYHKIKGGRTAKNAPTYRDG